MPYHCEARDVRVPHPLRAPEGQLTARWPDQDQLQMMFLLIALVCCLCFFLIVFLVVFFLVAVAVVVVCFFGGLLDGGGGGVACTCGQAFWIHQVFGGAEYVCAF